MIPTYPGFILCLNETRYILIKFTMARQRPTSPKLPRKPKKLLCASGAAIPYRSEAIRSTQPNPQPK